MVRVGDVVLIHDDMPKINWRMGIIEKLNEGADSFVRSVQLRNSTGRTNCPIARLYPPEVAAKNQAMNGKEKTEGQKQTMDNKYDYRPTLLDTKLSLYLDYYLL